MAVTTDTPPLPSDDRGAARSVLILVWAQSILGAQMPVHIILGGLAGALLSSDPALATLPISLTMLSSMCSAPIMSTIMGRFGRRTGFVLGALAGASSAALAVHALTERSFELFCLAGFLTGIYMSAHNFYRFAAADQASDRFRPKAVSWVMAGGLASAIIGPEIVQNFQHAMEPIPYAGAYRALVFLNLIGAIPLLFLSIPVLPRHKPGTAGGGRPWSVLLRDRRIVVAMLCAMVSYALMNLVMTSTPLAMIACGFVTDDAAEVVRLHVLAMFAPSFLTGPLIVRIGVERVIALGLVLLAACATVAMSGIAFGNFAIALILLGLGWNFGFIGATSMLVSAHRPEERSRIQGLNDFLVFGLVTVASFSSGALMAAIGWDAVNLAAVPFLTLAGGALVWLVLRERRSLA